MGGLLLGASRCSKDEDGNGEGTPAEGGGSSGSGSSDGGGVRCGKNTCASGQVCCNASCGICTKPGDACILIACDDGAGGAAGSRSGDDAGQGGSGGSSEAPMSSDAPRCGGIAARPCPGLGDCVDDPGDSCDPKKGGADCGGVCECSALAKCRDGQKFDPSPDVCACVGGDGAGSGGSGDAGSGGSGDPGGVSCGSNACTAGETCCNPSCGICTKPGEGCTKQLCPPDDPGTSEPARCGGFAGLPCPGAGECVDDPDDGCDPENGGADCGGICKCMSGAAVLCAQGTQWNEDPHVCACVANGGGGAAGETCGKAVCPADQSCCNASCGICAPKGGACIQIACL